MTNNKFDWASPAIKKSFLKIKFDLRIKKSLLQLSVSPMFLFSFFCIWKNILIDIETHCHHIQKVSKFGECTLIKNKAVAFHPLIYKISVPFKATSTVLVRPFVTVFQIGVNLLISTEDWNNTDRTGLKQAHLKIKETFNFIRRDFAL